MTIFLALSPVIIYVAVLVWMDTFKLVKYKNVIKTILVGMIWAVFAYEMNMFIGMYYKVGHSILIRYISPLVEETLKISIIVFLISRNKTGFMIDSVIYGFSVGTGFAIAENIYYYLNLADNYFLIHAVRGFGTAIMHGCTVALAGALFFYFHHIKNYSFARSLITSIIPSLVLHILYNHFFLPALVQTVIILMLSSLAVTYLFQKNDNYINNWINNELDNEMNFLIMLDSGKLSETRTGRYILDIKSRFTPIVIVDMICLIRLNLELSMQYKTYLMLKSNGLNPPLDTELPEKLVEYEKLKKNIGKTGLASLKPILFLNNKDLWKIEQLKH